MSLPVLFSFTNLFITLNSLQLGSSSKYHLHPEGVSQQHPEYLEISVGCSIFTFSASLKLHHALCLQLRYFSSQYIEQKLKTVSSTVPFFRLATGASALRAVGCHALHQQNFQYEDTLRFGCPQHMHSPNILHYF